MKLCLRILLVFHVSIALVEADGAPVAGAYVFGHEVRSLQPCGSSTVYWAKPLDTEVSDRLRSHHAELTAEPNGRIYVVVTGWPTSEKTTGFAESYDAYFEISRVLEAAGGIPPDCELH